jgi:Xaa-Pro aminopeptidase
LPLTRLLRLQGRLESQQLAGIIVTKAIHVQYLSGFSGSEAQLLVLPDQAYLCTDFRYIEQAEKEAQGWEIVKHDGDWQQIIKNLWTNKEARLGFEAEHLSYNDWEKLARQLPAVNLSPTSGLIEGLRAQKDQQELMLLKKAIALADKGAEHLSPLLIPGCTEREVAEELELFLRRQGAEKAAFPFIIASGARGSLPHGIASDKIIEAGEMVTVDFGAVYQGYHSDLTRVFVLGEPTAKQRSIYEIVLAAQASAIARAGPNVPCMEVDKAAREVIVAANYGDYFGHATGHGVGLEIHEAPRLSSQSADVLSPGMVVTVEPGIYLPNWGGVRIEDIILITDHGVEVLSQSPKNCLMFGGRKNDFK